MKPTLLPASIARLRPPCRRAVVGLVSHFVAWQAWAVISVVTPEYATSWNVIYAGVAIAAAGLLNRWLAGWLGAQFVIGGVVLGAVLKERLLREPLLAHDVVFFVRNVSGNVELLRAYPGYTTIGLALPALAGVVLVWSCRQEEVAITLRGVRRGFVHALLAVSCVTLVGWGWSRHFEQRVRQQTDELHSAVSFMLMREVNAVPRFVESFWDFAVREPHDVPQALRFHALMARTPPRPPPPAEAPRPDILVVLRESHVQLPLLWGAELPPDPPQPSAVHTEWQGKMRVHCIGGGTWLTEFSFLTGFCWSDFGNAGMYAPFTLAPRMKVALPVQLRRLGYRTVAFYPVAGSFLNARMAYTGYGFDEFYSSEELGLSKDWHQLSDRAIFAAALQRLWQQDDGRPVFAFVLTIRNHGPHDRAVPNREASQPRDWPPQLRRSVADFLDRQEETERDFTWLREQWLAAPAPRILVGFGDHWPSLEGGTFWLANRPPANSGVQQEIFQTPLAFAANYVTHHVPQLLNIDAAFVGGTLLEFAGLEADDFFSLNQWLRDYNAGLYQNARDPQIVRGYLTWAHRSLGAWR